MTARRVPSLPAWLLVLQYDHAGEVIELWWRAGSFPFNVRGLGHFEIFCAWADARDYFDRLVALLDRMRKGAA